MFALRSQRLLGCTLVERRHDGGLLLLREALGRLLGEHAGVAAQELGFQAEDGHEDAAEDRVGACVESTSRRWRDDRRRGDL